MKVLLTGADGQLGRCLHDVFAASHYTLVAMGRSQLNITDDIAVARVVEREAPDVILNAAAYTAVDKAESEPELASQINVLGPALLASAASKYDSLLVHISTDYVFDGAKTGPYLEEDEVSPLGVYGSSKLRGEVEIQRRCPKHVVLRTSWVFGEAGNNFPKTMLRLAENRTEISVVSDEYGCPTYTGDIANVCLEVVKAYAESNLNYGVYHYAGDRPVSWYQFAGEVFDNAVELGLLTAAPHLKAITSREFAAVAKRPANSVLSSEKVKMQFKVAPSNWSLGLKKLVNSMKSESKRSSVQ